MAGIEELPSLTTLDLSGHNLDSINISKNTSLTSFFAKFNTFKKINTNNNPDLIQFPIDANEVVQA